MIEPESVLGHGLLPKQMVKIAKTQHLVSVARQSPNIHGPIREHAYLLGEEFKGCISASQRRQRKDDSKDWPHGRYNGKEGKPNGN